jgi:hypothetical protein
MVVLFNAFCLPPITQVARKDVGDMKPRQQIRDWLALSRARGKSRAREGNRRGAITLSTCRMASLRRLGPLPAFSLVFGEKRRSHAS